MGNGNFSTESSLGDDDIPNLLEWDKDKKGNIIELSNNRKTFSTGTNYISWNCILSKNVFTTGVNYVETYINKIGEGFLFYGIGTNSNIPYNECIGGSQSCLVAGYDARFVQSSHPSVVKHTITDSIPKFSEPQKVGLIIDMEKKELSYIIKGNRILAYSNIPPSVHIFACAAHNVDITFTKHIKGEKKIQNYLNKSDKLNCELNNFNSLLEWDITNKGPIFSLSDSNRTFTTGQNYIAWNCILSKNSVTSGAHYVEASIDTSGLGFLFYGIATPDNIPYGECIGGAQSCLVAGYDARFVERCHPGVVKHQIVDLIPKFTQTQVVGLYVDMDRKEFSYVIQGKKLLAYSNIPSPVHVFACSAHAVTVSLTKYIVGRQKAEDYLDQMEMQIKYLRGKMNETEGANSAHSSLLEWDPNNKGPIFQLSNMDKTISTGPNYVSWNCILSKNNVNSGVHYIEAQLEKSGGGFLFFGIATTDNIPLYECIGGAQSCLVVGYDARFLQSSHPNVVKLPIADTIPKFTQPQAIGMLIDLEKKELSFVISGNLYLCYVNIPSNVHVFACAAHDITLTLTKHIVGRDEISKMFN